ncbi:hypothetical protein RRG08_014869 [Elysia crispata]|uniref:Uncharacterized protein n=1 Tax=Elysia crispata TaxID=231223 RepID=A0AAE1AM26_9GAST|nr:hypothetical protein RRG08_014869 [Elysia crispata]
MTSIPSSAWTDDGWSSDRTLACVHDETVRTPRYWSFEAQLAIGRFRSQSVLTCAVELSQAASGVYIVLFCHHLAVFEA